MLERQGGAWDWLLADWLQAVLAILGVTIVCVLAYRAWKRPDSSKVVRLVLAGTAASYLLCFVLFLVFSILVDHENTQGAGQEETVQGTISKVVCKEKILAGDSPSCFTVNGVRFELGELSVNPLLRASKNGGPIKEGLSVKIKHRGGYITMIEGSDCRNWKSDAKAHSAVANVDLSPVLIFALLAGACCGSAYVLMYFLLVVPALRKKGYERRGGRAALQVSQSLRLYCQDGGKGPNIIKGMMVLCQIFLAVSWLGAFGIMLALCMQR